VNLVNELQVSCERDDVQTVLRKARRVASKLGVDDINQWLKLEQEGYGDKVQVPKYRRVTAALVFKTMGYVPIGMGYAATGVIDFPGGIVAERNIRDSMSRVVQMIATPLSEDLFMTIDEEAVAPLRRRFDPQYSQQLTFMLRLNRDQICSIPDSVKDRVLDWSLTLERRGVLGENMTFNETEKAEAHNITFNINNSQIEQLNNMGQNLRRNDG
jgi:hypothetical protein